MQLNNCFIKLKYHCGRIEREREREREREEAYTQREREILWPLPTDLWYKFTIYHPCPFCICNMSMRVSQWQNSNTYLIKTLNCGGIERERESMLASGERLTTD